MKRSQSGFTLIETLISLTIVIIIIFSYLNFFTNSQLLLKRANERLELLQLAENKLNDLLSSPFFSPALANGKHAEESSRDKKIYWQVYSVSPELKEITLHVVYKNQQSKFKFYRSLFIGDKNE